MNRRRVRMPTRSTEPTVSEVIVTQMDEDHWHALLLAKANSLLRPGQHIVIESKTSVLVVNDGWKR